MGEARALSPDKSKPGGVLFQNKEAYQACILFDRDELSKVFGKDEARWQDKISSAKQEIVQASKTR